MTTKTGTRWTKWVEQPNARQRAVLDQLAELGRERAELQAHRAYMTSTGRRTYDQVIGKIRRQIDKGVELGLGHEQLRAQVGVNSTAYYKIKGHRTAPDA